MINLDQVRTLEWKVKQAVQLIVHLRRENDTLRGRLSDTEVRLQELESLLESFKASQSELESGIRSALEELDNLESDGPTEVNQVDPLSYPPQAKAEPERESAPEPEAAVPVSEPVPEPAASEDPTFDEEYAALAAAEAEALEAMASEEPEGEVEPAPSSVELVEETVLLDTETEEEIEVDLGVEEPVVEEKRPEQPGLGIF